MISLTPSRIIALTVASLLFMEQLDGTILATALPSIARSLDVDPVLTSVALTSYIVGLAIFIPASGAVADRLGSRTTLMVAITLFMACSMLCGVAGNLELLAFGRIFQGMGGALMAPVGRLVLLRSVPRSELLGVMMWMMMPATLGPMLGPVIGGVITTLLSWRWAFYVNVPVGFIGLWLTWRYIPQLREDRPPPFDWKGFALAGGSLALLSFGAELVSHATRPLWLSVVLLLAGSVLFVVCYRHMCRYRAPMLDFRLMEVPTFRLSVLGGAASRLAVGAFPFLMPSLLQLSLGLDAARSGLIMLAAPLGAVVARLRVPQLFRRFGFRRVMMVTGGGAAFVFGLLACIRPGWPLWVIPIILFASGIMQAIQFSAYNSIAYADLPETHMSAATSFYSTFQQIMLSAGISVAVLAVTISRLMQGHVEVTGSDFDVGFLVTGALSLFAIPMARCLAPDAGASVSGHRGSSLGKDEGRENVSHALLGTSPDRVSGERAPTPATRE
ncbi:MFS transporter [Acetobacter estunensis]|uniref:MFS transporter n=1 Tax=Acetobacter estunensis TaxID=104097 RepID=UPI001C2D511A|nr:MFS transporter [Acetobacter estunensis]MBV1838370.1 MFS transporter [Acetobacter estunensis]